MLLWYVMLWVKAFHNYTCISLPRDAESHIQNPFDCVGDCHRLPSPHAYAHAPRIWKRARACGVREKAPLGLLRPAQATEGHKLLRRVHKRVELLQSECRTWH